MKTSIKQALNLLTLLGISMTLANQFTSQIRTRGLLDAVFGNVGTLIAFRVGRSKMPPTAQ